jgi:TPR repeat protein
MFLHPFRSIRSAVFVPLNAFHGCTNFTPLAITMLSLPPPRKLQRRTFADSTPLNNSDSALTPNIPSDEEVVASGIRLLQDKDPASAIELLQQFENSDNVLALSALGRSLLAAADSLNEADSDVDHSELAMQLKRSIRKLARANTIGKSGGCRSSTIDADSVASMVARGLTCLKKAVQLGNDALSQTALANHAVASFQRGATKDLDPALSLYEAAGVAGDADAWYNLGILYYNGIGVPVDRERSLTCIRKAADLGDCSAHFFLYSQSDDSSPASAMHLDAAASAGHPEAIYYKAMTLQDKSSEFIPALVSAAEKGSVSAAATLGSLHYSGQSGATQSPSLAAKWWVIAASAGHAGASHNLAVMYEHGVPEIGFRRDYSMCVARARAALFNLNCLTTVFFEGHTHGTALLLWKATLTACSAWRT